ncbi:Uncharacterized protein QTN25_000792 [Entamoeba marina]
MSSTDQSELAKTLGNQLFKEKKYNGALEQYAKAIEFNPNNHILYSNQSACYYCLDQLDEALESANKCISINPKFIRGYIRKASVLSKQNHKSESIEILKNALLIEPNNMQLINTLEDFIISYKNEINKTQLDELKEPFVTIDDDQLFNLFKTNYSKEEYQTIIDDVLQIEEITNPYYKAQCYIMLSKAMIQTNNSDYREYIEKSISIYPLQEAMNILENKQI